MTNGQGSYKHFREIAEKIRELARQTQIVEIRKELFDLADNLDRMAERAKKTQGQAGERPENG